MAHRTKKKHPGQRPRHVAPKVPGPVTRWGKIMVCLQWRPTLTVEWLAAIVSVYFAAVRNVAFWSQPSPAVSCSNSPTHRRNSARTASTSSSSSRMSARQSDRRAPGAPPVKDDSLSTVCSIP